MALDPRYFVTSDVDTYFVDKDTGLPLSNGTLTFYRDISRTTPKPVYQLSGFPPNYTYTSMGAIITLSAVGTVQNSGGDNEVIYYFPYDADGNLDLYYVVGADQDGNVQFTREGWPNITAADNPTTDIAAIPNQIANSQFSEIFINEGFTTSYNVTSATNQVCSLAPDWDFVISGSGSVVVQRIPVAGNEKVVSSPPYILDVSLTGGITKCQLRQRFNVNSGLWASTADQLIFLAGTFVARNENSGTTGIRMFYLDSTGGAPVNIVDALVDNSQYATFSGVTAAAMPLSNNTDTGLNGFIDIYIDFSLSSHVRITSLQVVPTNSSAGPDFQQYDLNSSNREEAYMGDYYLPALKRRPAPSLLTAWDFPLNPFQSTDTISLLTQPQYICDQTIALLGNTGNVSVSQTNAGALQFITTGTNDSFYIMQYLSGSQAKKILGTDLSVNMAAYKSPLNADDVITRVYLFRAGNAAIVPILPSSLGTLAADGTFTLTATGWTEIPRSNLDTAKAFLPGINITDFDFDTRFNGWEITDDAQIADTDKFAIVVTFNYMDANTEIDIYSIALTPGSVPCRPAPQSSDEVLRECQYYYEKTYEIVATPGTITNSTYRTYKQEHSGDGVNTFVYPRFWEISYLVPKRVLAIPRIYSPNTGALGQVFVISYQGTSQSASGDAPITDWTIIANGTRGVDYQANARGIAILTALGVPSATLGGEGIIVFHWVADSRLGIIP